MNERELLLRTAELAADFVDSLDTRRVFPETSVDELGEALGGPLPEQGADPLEVVEQLARDAEAGVVASAGGRYFGFVIGGSVPAALAADWLTSTWDQCAGMGVLGPSALVAEQVAGNWLKELFGLPAEASFGFTTGCQMAHVTALAAARHAVLERAGWDVEADGLAGSPPITWSRCANRHVTLGRALRLLGIGKAQITVVAADDRGRMDADALERALDGVDGPAIVCAQAGEVNTGRLRPARRGSRPRRGPRRLAARRRRVRDVGRGEPRAEAPAAGLERADSWATDAHKWLNVPYDCGVAFCAHPEAHRAAMRVSAAYLVESGAWHRDATDWTPESSRRARGLPVYAALRSLGRAGVAELIDRCCALALRFAAGLSELPAPRSSTTSCSTRCCSASPTTRRPPPR